MTDKQIIIDGVDVRKCVNRRWDNSQKIHLCYDSDTPLTSWGWCENNPNCYYKQLKRKEQECEELKEGYSELTDIVSPYMDDFTGYNEELGGFDIVLCVKELMEQLDQLKSENKHINDLLNQALKDYEKAIETLTEIKEIAERDKEICIKCNGNKEIDCVECIEGGRALLANDILQKISECEVK